MNKKRLIYFFSLPILVVIFVFIWLFVSSLGVNKSTLPPGYVSPDNFKDVTARDAANWDEPFLRKIEPEFIDSTEKAALKLEDNPRYRLQVLERDANGKPTAYKKIYNEADIIEYVYDPLMGGDSTSPTSTIIRTEGIK